MVAARTNGRLENITKALFVTQGLVMLVISLVCLLTGSGCKLDEITCVRLTNLSRLGLVSGGIQMFAGCCSFVKSCLSKPIHALGVYVLSAVFFSIVYSVVFWYILDYLLKADNGSLEVTIALFVTYWILVIIQLFIHGWIVHGQPSCRAADSSVNNGVWLQVASDKL